MGVFMSRPKKLKQLWLPFDAIDLLPGNVVVVQTNDLDLATEAGSETCIRRMLAVPLAKSILLDYLIGRKRGDPHPSETHADLHRLMALLNSRYHSVRFDFLGDSLTVQLFRQAVVHDVPALLARLAARRANEAGDV